MAMNYRIQPARGGVVGSASEADARAAQDRGGVGMPTAPARLVPAPRPARSTTGQ
jgi:hypothetical protein